MPQPKKKHTKTRKRVRRAAIKHSTQSLTTCPKCKKPVKPHTACSFCGTYKQKEVLKMKTKQKKMVEKESKEVEKETKKTQKEKKVKK